MKKTWSKILGVISYALGIFCSLYVGGWLMLIKPIKRLIVACSTNQLTIKLLIFNIVVIALSTTFAGFVWCIGYLGYNFFKGKDDPDWEAMEQKWKEKKLAREEKKKQREEEKK